MPQRLFAGRAPAAEQGRLAAVRHLLHLQGMTHRSDQEHSLEANGCNSCHNDLTVVFGSGLVAVKRQLPLQILVPKAIINYSSMRKISQKCC